MASASNLHVTSILNRISFLVCSRVASQVKVELLDVYQWRILPIEGRTKLIYYIRLLYFI